MGMKEIIKDEYDRLDKGIKKLADALDEFEEYVKESVFIFFPPYYWRSKEEENAYKYVHQLLKDINQVRDIFDIDYDKSEPEDND